MKKIRTGRLLVFFGVLLIAAGMIVGGSLAAAGSPSWLTEKDYIEATASSDAAVSLEDMKDIAESLSSPVAWWGNEAGIVSADRRQTRADIYAVGGPFTDFHPVRMLKGSFISPLGDNGNSIVLDEGLAWELFGTTDAVGMEAEFQDRTYTVAGICAGDTSLLGMLSGNGLNRAYIGYGTRETIRITGMAAALPASLPGKSLQAVKDALGSLGMNTVDFLFRDLTEDAKLDAESAGLPALVLAAIFTAIAIASTKAALNSMARRLPLILKETYFSDSWRTVLRQIGYMALAVAAAAGIVSLVWLLTDFPFFLPGRFIPGSWIDIDFYKNLLQTQAQERITAFGYIPQHWNIARDAAMHIAGTMNMAVLAGMAVYGAGLALLRDAREMQTGCLKGLKSGTMDIPMVWIFLIASIGAGFLICSAMGIGTELPPGRTAAQCAVLTGWAGWSLYRGRINCRELLKFPEVKENQ
jgi:hypothetical protein